MRFENSRVPGARSQEFEISSVRKVEMERLSSSRNVLFENVRNIESVGGGGQGKCPYDGRLALPISSTCSNFAFDSDRQNGNTGEIKEFSEERKKEGLSENELLILCQHQPLCFLVKTA